MKPKINPTDDAEIRLLKYEQWDDGVQRGDTYANPPATCNICKTSLVKKRFMVDSNIQPGGCMWACMCASCFFKRGEAIAWGRGQLYTQLESGKWLLTGGFPPEE